MLHNVGSLIGAKFSNLDHRRTGQRVCKSSTIGFFGESGAFYEIPSYPDERRCENGGSHQNSRNINCGDLARYPPAFMGHLALGISTVMMQVGVEQVTLSQMPPSLHSPLAPHECSDRVARHTAWHETDDGGSQLVRVGFKERPIRAGAGKTSLGRLAPADRRTTALTEKDVLIIVPITTKKLHLPDAKTWNPNPYGHDTLSKVTEILGKGTYDGKVEVGQPLHLDLLRYLLVVIGGADAGFPQILFPSWGGRRDPQIARDLANKN